MATTPIRPQEDFAQLADYHFDTVLFQAKSGFMVTKAVNTFFKGFCKEQHHCAVMLAKLTLDHQKQLKELAFPDRMVKSFHATNTFFQCTQSMADLIKLMVEEVHANVLKPLGAFSQAHSQLNQTAENSMANMLGEVSKRQKEVSDMKTAAMEAIEAQKAHAKNKKKHAKALEKSTAAVVAYKQALTNANEACAKIRRTEAPKVVSEVVNMEQLRLESISQAIEKFADIQKSYGTKFDSLVQSLTAQSVDIDSLGNIDHFFDTILGQSKDKNMTSKQSFMTQLPFDLELPEDLQPLIPKTMFGAKLEQITESDKKNFPTTDARYAASKAPAIFNVLLDRMKDDDALKCKEMFTGSLSKEAKVEAHALRNQLEGGAFDVARFSPDVVADVLKVWLRELPEPVIPVSLYKKFVDVGPAAIKDPESSTVTSAAQAAIQSLPDMRREIVEQLLATFGVYAAGKEGSKQMLSAIAQALSPLLFGLPGEGVAVQDHMNNTQAFLQVVLKTAMSKAEAGEGPAGKSSGRPSKQREPPPDPPGAKRVSNAKLPASKPPSGAKPPAGKPPAGEPPSGAKPPAGKPPAGEPPSGAKPPAGKPPAGAKPPAGKPPAGAPPAGSKDKNKDKDKDTCDPEPDSAAKQEKEKDEDKPKPKPDSTAKTKAEEKVEVSKVDPKKSSEGDVRSQLAAMMSGGPGKKQLKEKEDKPVEMTHAIKPKAAGRKGARHAAAFQPP